MNYEIKGMRISLLYIEKAHWPLEADKKICYHQLCVVAYVTNLGSNPQLLVPMCHLTLTILMFIHLLDMKMA